MAVQDEAIRDAIVTYGTRHEMTVSELAQRFFAGMWSFPDDVGMALAISVAGMGMLGTRVQQTAREVQQNVAIIICQTLQNPANATYLIGKYVEYMSTDGRWHGMAAQSAGRFVGGQVTNKLLWRSQRMADQAGAARRLGRPTPKPGLGSRLTVSASLFVLATYGAMCRAVLSGRRDFISLLHAVATGDHDIDLGRLGINMAHDAPWRQRLNELPDATEVISHFQEVCRFNRSGH